MTIKELKEICDERIKQGYGDLNILISDDEEGNGFHDLCFGIEPYTKADKYLKEQIRETIKNKESPKNYCVLG